MYVQVEFMQACPSHVSELALTAPREIVKFLWDINFRLNVFVIYLYYVLKVHKTRFS